jgi:hypothetical protein
VENVYTPMEQSIPFDGCFNVNFFSFFNSVVASKDVSRTPACPRTVTTSYIYESIHSCSTKRDSLGNSNLSNLNDARYEISLCSGSVPMFLNVSKF